MTLQEKLKMILRDYPIGDILFSFAVIFKEDSNRYFEKNELISAKENHFIAEALSFACSKVIYLPGYGNSSIPESVSLPKRTERLYARQGITESDDGSK